MEHSLMFTCALPPPLAGTAPTDGARWRPHDLLRLARPPKSVPGWVSIAFAQAPYAVVRRAPSARGLVPVGFRGATRSQRHGDWVDANAILDRTTPESLLPLAPASGRNALPAFAALAHLRGAPSPLDAYEWGPTGSAGFELAAHCPVVTATSDLDILLRMPERPAPAALRALRNALEQAAVHAGTRIDAQVETPAGAAALAELVASKPLVLIRAAKGASFVADPWQTT